MKPWEKRQNLKPSLKPWEKRSQVSAPQGASDALLGGQYGVRDIKNKFDDRLSTMDRFAVKNFGNNNTSGSIQMLSKKYPGLEFESNDGGIIFRGKGESQWSKLDPSFVASFSDPMEFVRDVTDLTSDVVGGAIEGAATTAGAIGGSLVKPGLGTMAGASIANSAASAGTEALKQTIGSEVFDIPENYNMGNIQTAGMMGAASPLLFGAGKLPMNKLSKGVTDSIAQKTGQPVTQQALDKMSRGVPGMAWDGVKSKVLPTFAGYTSGVDSQFWKSYTKNFDELNNWFENPSLAVRASEEARKGFRNEMDLKKAAIRKEIIDSLEQAGVPVNIESVKAVYKQKISDLGSKANVQGGMQVGDKSLMNALADDYKRIFGIEYGDETRSALHTTMKEVPQKVEKVPVAVDYETFPTTETRLVQGEKPVGGKLRSEHSLEPGRLSDEFEIPPAKQPVSDSIIVEIPGEKKTAIGYKPVYKDPKFEVATMVSQFKTNPRDGYIDPLTLSHVRPPTEISDDLGGRDAFKLQARLRESANYDAKHRDSLNTTASAANEALRNSMETATAGASQTAKDKFSNLKYAEDDLLAGLLDNPNAFFNEMTRLPKNSNLVRQEGLDLLGFDTVGLREKIGAFNMLSKPADMPISSNGITATARGNAMGEIGSLAGGMAGGPIGERIGNTAMRGLSSARMYKSLMKLNDAAERGIRNGPLDYGYNLLGNYNLRDRYQDEY